MIEKLLPIGSTRNAIMLSAGLLLLAMIAGVASVGYASVAGGNLVRLAALPAAIVLLMVLIFDKERLFIGIFLLRAGADIAFSEGKFDLGGYAFGIGGVVNAFVMLIAALYLIQTPRALSRRMLLPWGMFLLVVLVGVVRAPAMGEAIRTALGLMSWAAVFVIAQYLVANGRSFGGCVRIVMLSTIIPVIGGLISLATGHGVVEGRLAGMFSHPNIFAFYLVLAISLALYTSRQPTCRYRSLMSLYMLVLLGLLALTQTRSAWISCTALFAAYGLFFERRYLVYLALAPVVALMIPEVRDRLLDLQSGNEYVMYAKLNSFAWRKLIWESGLSWMSPMNYLAGYGLEAFYTWSPIFFPLSGGNNFGAHNIFVQLIFDLGVVGLLLFLNIFAKAIQILRGGMRVDRLGAAIMILLMLAYLVTAFSDNMFGYLVFNWYFWFMVGAGCAAWGAKSDKPEAGITQREARP
ncbi:MAG: hypothetical protein JWL63_607 [Rhodocyclales bacterium]|nr:hypothetical protein [Rhodocyclales bacterium]